MISGVSQCRPLFKGGERIKRLETRVTALGQERNELQIELKKWKDAAKKHQRKLQRILIDAKKKQPVKVKAVVRWQFSSYHSCRKTCVMFFYGLVYHYTLLLTFILFRKWDVSLKTSNKGTNNLDKGNTQRSIQN